MHKNLRFLFSRYLRWQLPIGRAESNNRQCKIFLSSSSSSLIFHGVGPLVDPFRSHASRSLFSGLPWFLLPVGEYCFIALGNLLRGILFTWCIQFLLYSCSLSRICVIFNSFAICVFVLWYVQVYPVVLLMYFVSAAVILVASLALMVQRK